MQKQSRELEVKQDLEFQRREWRLQQVGWFALTAFVAAAALGLFGGGPLSPAHARGPGTGLEIDYDRFIRVGAATRVTVRGLTAARPGDPLQLRIPREYFESFRVDRISPEPDAMLVGAREVTLQYGAGPADPSGLTVILDLEPIGTGRRAGAVRSNGAQASFWQFAYF